MSLPFASNLCVEMQLNSMKNTSESTASIVQRCTHGITSGGAHIRAARQSSLILAADAAAAAAAAT